MAKGGSSQTRLSQQDRQGKRPGTLKTCQEALERIFKGQAQFDADRWAKVRGSERWKGLIPGLGNSKAPIDTYLRAELIKYGELAQATYDGFEKRKYSLYFSHPYFSYNELLPTVCRASWSYLVPRDGDDQGGEGCRQYKIQNEEDFLMAPPNLYRRTLLGKKEDDEGSSEEKEPVDPEEDPRTWIGYMAVGDVPAPNGGVAGKDIVVAFRGTVLDSEWFWDANSLQKSPSEPLEIDTNIPEDIRSQLDKVCMHSGFLNLYGRCADKDHTTKGDTEAPPTTGCGALRGNVRTRLQALLKELAGQVKSITIVGHSLGGALAAVCAFDLGLMRKDTRYAALLDGVNITAYTFAGPRVGNPAYRSVLRDVLQVPLLNVVNYGDIVPCVPNGIWGLPNGLADPQAPGGVPAFLLSAITKVPGNALMSLHALRALAYPPAYWWLSLRLADEPWTAKLFSYVDSGETLVMDSQQDQSRDIVDPLFDPNPQPLVKRLFARGEGSRATIVKSRFPLFVHKNLGKRHNLEGYLFVVATQHTSPEHPPFWRDPALLNKSQDLLEPVLAERWHIPEAWWSPVPNAALVPHHDHGTALNEAAAPVWGYPSGLGKAKEEGGLAKDLILAYMRMYGIKPAAATQATAATARSSSKSDAAPTKPSITTPAAPLPTTSTSTTTTATGSSKNMVTTDTGTDPETAEAALERGGSETQQ